MIVSFSFVRLGVVFYAHHKMPTNKVVNIEEFGNQVISIIKTINYAHIKGRLTTLEVSGIPCPFKGQGDTLKK